jgi:23S rRNA (guanine2445-N2)-methyltransferase / 23S rRNA (guanine2069-N7)-methyltransferase
VNASVVRHELMVTAPGGFADLLLTELRDAGAEAVEERTYGARCLATLESAYRICLHSRIASRVLLVLARVPAATAEELYAGVQSLDWTTVFTRGATFAIDAKSTASQLSHTQFITLKAKDAVVDQLRERWGERPDIDPLAPALRLHVRLSKDVASLALDLAGEPLHRRGYRARGVAAPLKENLAAGLLLRSGWPAIAAAGGGFVDPLCGSGTLVIEAALMAGGIAPGLLRSRFGFEAWAGHDAPTWHAVKAAADAARARSGLGGGRLFGRDRDGQAVRAARENAQRAGVAEWVDLQPGELSQLLHPRQPTGLLLVNPPYGERLGEVEELKGLYASLGTVLRERYVGWKAAVFTGNPPLCKFLRLEARRSHTLFNGPIECRLLRFEVAPEHFHQEREPGRPPTVAAAAAERPGARMFANRLAKNLAERRKWAAREAVSCYRLYDADMPEYAFAIDWYGTSPPAVYVQEYAAPRSIDPARVKSRREEVLASLPGVLGVQAAQLYFRTRRPQGPDAQYTKVATAREFHEVEEGGLRFLVNFTDYLDTGLFLDHRPVRGWLRDWVGDQRRELARDPRRKPVVRFLNLFAYTGAASVHAAAAGAETTTVDLSHTYLDWARENFRRNRLEGPAHSFVQADCLQWVHEQATAARAAQAAGRPGGWDLIFLDPPTFSNSKRMQGTWDVQRDHAALLRDVVTLLAPGGLLVFSTNATRFRLDPALLAEGSGLAIEDVTARSIPADFARDGKIHACFLIRRTR